MSDEVSRHAKINDLVNKYCGINIVLINLGYRPLYCLRFHLPTTVAVTTKFHILDATLAQHSLTRLFF